MSARSAFESAEYVMFHFATTVSALKPAIFRETPSQQTARCLSLAKPPAKKQAVQTATETLLPANVAWTHSNEQQEFFLKRCLRSRPHCLSRHHSITTIAWRGDRSRNSNPPGHVLGVIVCLRQRLSASNTFLLRATLFVHNRDRQRRVQLNRHRTRYGTRTYR